MLELQASASEQNAMLYVTLRGLGTAPKVAVQEYIHTGSLPSPPFPPPTLFSFLSFKGRVCLEVEPSQPLDPSGSLETKS